MPRSPSTWDPAGGSRSAGRLDPPAAEERPIAVRAYAEVATLGRGWTGWQEDTPRQLGFSEWTLVLDTETTTDAAQQLRFGAYQLRDGGVLYEAGLFYDPESLSPAEVATLTSHAEADGLAVHTRSGFVDEVFYAYAYDRNALVVAFNMPFDVSRLAIDHDSARGRMRGGFTFKLSQDPARPNVQVKHLSSRAALVQFAAPRGERTPRSHRRKKRKVPVKRGYFADVRSLAAALTGEGHSLPSIAALLKTPHQKQDADEHGASLTPEYVAYAVTDVQVTWEAFDQLSRRYQNFQLAGTPINRVLSEASIGKAYLRQMGIQSWRDLQPDFPVELLGVIMSSYYGGRSEVHIRRQVSRVLYCDFLSMYPTVCTLMGLWRFVTARGVEWDDTAAATAETQAFLDAVRPDDLQDPTMWRRLVTLVQVRAEGDIFPVRARYAGEERQYTIGQNHLTSHQPLWYTLADCIASTLLTGKPPRVVRAIRFRPLQGQDDLQPILIAGNPAYPIDPATDDFYQRLIELRKAVQAQRDEARSAGDESRAAQLDADQLAIKITANASSYGIFVELNVTQHARLQDVTCYGPSKDTFASQLRNTEQPGSFYHPLLATLITGAARLMLALAEHHATLQGISWAMCDTDSMALAQPVGIGDSEFIERAHQVQAWFQPLNPYRITDIQAFQIEDANHPLTGKNTSTRLHPLYCLAVSAKRYGLFNIDQHDRPILRKASAHGLGHLLAPYPDTTHARGVPKPRVSVRDLGVSGWQHDLWHLIIQAALDDHPDQVNNLKALPQIDDPATSRYAATTPTLLRWFTDYNQDRAYRDQVRPFGFLLAYQPHTIPTDEDEQDDKPTGQPRRASSWIDLPHAISPYDRDPRRIADHIFDRQTGHHISPDQLKTVRQALAQYHLQPEAKFAGGDYTDTGTLHRRHIHATAIEHIGKEANQWEEQLHLGHDPEAQIIYGTTAHDLQNLLAHIQTSATAHSQAHLAEQAGISPRSLYDILHGQRKLSHTMIQKLLPAIDHLNTDQQEDAAAIAELLDQVRQRCHAVGLRHFAAQAGINPSNLSNILKGRRPLGAAQAAILRKAILSD